MKQENGILFEPSFRTKFEPDLWTEERSWLKDEGQDYSSAFPSSGFSGVWAGLSWFKKWFTFWLGETTRKATSTPVILESSLAFSNNIERRLEKLSGYQDMHHPDHLPSWSDIFPY